MSKVFMKGNEAIAEAAVAFLRAIPSLRRMKFRSIFPGDFRKLAAFLFRAKARLLPSIWYTVRRPPAAAQ